MTSWAGIWCQSNQGMKTSCALLQGSISARHALNHTKRGHRITHTMTLWSEVLWLLKFLLDISSQTEPVWFNNFHSAPSIWALSRLCPVKGEYFYQMSHVGVRLLVSVKQNSYDCNRCCIDEVGLNEIVWAWFWPCKHIQTKRRQLESTIYSN